MTNLAIRGHKTRGKEVIEILEMLGGNNPHKYVADNDCFYFYISYETRNICYDWFYNFDDKDVTIFTLEQFLENFPYMVGDKVQHKGATSCGSIFEIEKMRWEEDTIKYTLRLFGCNYKTCTLPAEYLQPYKEETMKEIIKIDIPKGYEFAGVDDDKQRVVFEKINCQYPKNFKECCEVLGCKANHFFTNFSYDGCDVEISDCEDKIDDLLQNFRKLLYCRNAYWKTAGEQMGLGKPWEPDWTNDEWPDMAFISYDGKSIDKDYGFPCCNVILIFPTEEMRDAFYENFNDLIKKCKDLL